MRTSTTATITIYLKTKKDNGEKESVSLSDLSLHKAKKIYHKLVKMWDKKKCVQLNTHYLTVASDLIHTIIMES